MRPEDTVAMASAVDGRGREIGPAQTLDGLASVGWAPILGSLPPTEQRLLARAAVPLAGRKGNVLFRAGEECRSLLLLQSGVVKVSAGSGGHDLPVAILGPGDLLGTSAGATDRRSAYTATVLEDAQLLAVPGSTLRKALMGRKAAANQLFDVLDRRRQIAEAVAGNWGRLAAARRARVIAVHSPRGGAGATTIALHLAHALALDHPRDVVLVDLGLPFNQCAFLTRSTPTTSLARAQQAPDRYRDDILVSGVCSRTSGFGLLNGVLHPEEADLLTPELINHVLHVLRREFAYVVIDLGLRTSGLVRAASEGADEILVPLPTDLLALNDAIALRARLGDLSHRMRFIVNHPTPRATLNGDAVRRVLEVEHVAEIPYDPDLMRAISKGTPMLAAERPGPAVSAIVKLAHALVATARPPAREPAGHPRRRQSRWIIG